MKPDQLRLRQSWNVELMVCLLTLAIEGMIFFSPLSGPMSLSRKIQWAHLALAAALLPLLFRLRARWSQAKAVTFHLLLILPFFVLNVSRHRDFLQLQQPWVPLAGTKLLGFVIAVFVPGPLWVSALLLFAAFLEGVVLWYGFGTHANPYVIHGTEPLSLLMNFTVAASFLAFRYRDDRTIRALSIELARKEVLEDIARVFLSIRDLSNTPLQTLALQTELFSRRHPDPKDQVQLEAIRVNLARLTDLNRILAQLDDRVDWKSETVLSESEIRDWLRSLS